MSRTSFVLYVAMAAIAAAGCSSGWGPFGTKVRHVQGIRSPSERADQLHELAKKANETSDPAQREVVCQQLAQEIRGENDPNLRCEILRTISAYGGPTADNVLRVAVSDPDADVRVVVCGLWGLKGTVEAGQILASMLTSDVDRDVRIAAARGMGNVRDPVVVKPLGAALDDTDPAIQHRAVVSLEASTGNHFDEDVNRWREWVKTNGQSSGQAQSIADRVIHIFW